MTKHYCDICHKELTGAEILKGIGQPIELCSDCDVPKWREWKQKETQNENLQNQTTE